MSEPPNASSAPPGTLHGRRAFLRAVAALATAAALPEAVPAQTAGPAPAPDAGVAPYLALDEEEASFTEALVDTLCPADHLTPSGTACGLALFFDRQLAGAYGQG